MMISNLGPEGPVVDVSARFRAPPDKIYAAWTRPELISRWFFAEEGFRSEDVRVSLEPLGAYQIVVRPLDGGEPTRIHGHYVDVGPANLTYTWTGACAGEQYWTLVRVAFELAAEGGSLVKLTHGVFRTDADRAMHEQGWFSCLACLDRMLAES